MDTVPTDASVPGSLSRGSIPARGRLAGKVAIVTGAGGNIGLEIVRQFLTEGASVALLGRNLTKLDAARSALIETIGSDVGDRSLCVSVDVGDPVRTREAVEEILARFGRIDVLVNNAGSAGPRQRLEDVPITAAELEALQAGGSTDTETVLDAARNIFGVAWNMVRAARPHLAPGASIVNVSTIFSRTEYFGRVAYTVPKAALNTWSRRLAYELGPAGIRVNTVFPGPIESDRIRNVFSSMDDLRSVPPGTTAEEIVDRMTLARPGDGGTDGKVLPSITDVAGTIVFLASDDSAAINGHNFEITHGMMLEAGNASTFTSRADFRIVDASGRRVLVVGGDDLDDALTIARAHAARGADVLVGLPTADLVTAATNALEPVAGEGRIDLCVLDRVDPESIAAVLRRAGATLHGSVILPRYGRAHFAQPFAKASDAEVEEFLRCELAGAIAVARGLTRHWKAVGTVAPPPRIAFCSNGDDGRGNAYAAVLKAAVEQLVRVWRNETEVDKEAGRRESCDWSNQVIRWTNGESEELAFAAAWTAKLLHTRRKTKPVNLYLPDALASGVGAERADFGKDESLIGLHLGKVALITGGSAGIGGQIGKQLAIAGAKVVLAARGAEQLNEMRDDVLRELRAIGYDDPGSRVIALDGVDVSDLPALDRAVKATIERFGRVDYLINNAGVAGAEQMVVDMGLEDWRRTLRANLTSNFALMARTVPEMKKRGSGYILNVSSYFGGEKYVAVAYPNRSDYAVSKAGQRAMVETLAAFVGPEVQINAIAPGPVDGARLRGKDGGAGLYLRRGKLIVESRRLALLYSAIINAVRNGADARRLIEALLRNEIAKVEHDPNVPYAVSQLVETIRKAKPPVAAPSSYDYFMNEAIAKRLCARLVRGGYLPAESVCPLAVVPPEPFFDQNEIAAEGEKVRTSVLKMLHLRKMPTETDVALATVYFLADRAISGETFQPSGGLRQERSVTERELFGRSKDERVEQLYGSTVWIVGEAPLGHLVRAVKTYLEDARAARIVLLTRTEQTAAAVRKAFPANAPIVTRAIGMEIESGLDAALREFERPAAVVSMPFGLIHDKLFDGPGSLDGEGFEAMLEEQITNHFRVGRVASLFDDTRLVFVSPDIPIGGNGAEFALANLIKTTLHALTATLAVENERLVHEVPVNQVNTTRRAQSEEPRNVPEQQEELDRFARALILASGPLPQAEASRYRSRIYRGMAITV